MVCEHVITSMSRWCSAGQKIT